MTNTCPNCGYGTAAQAYYESPRLCRALNDCFWPIAYSDECRLIAVHLAFIPAALPSIDGYGSERIKATVATGSSARRSARGRNRVMDSEQKIKGWNVRWMIVAGGRCALAALKARHWKIVRSPFLMPAHARLAMRNPSIRGLSCTAL